MRRSATALFAALAIVTLASCSSDAGSGPTTNASATTDPATTDSTTGPDGGDTTLATAERGTTTTLDVTTTVTVPGTGDTAETDLTVARPFEVYAPDSYDDARPMPLVVLLHGYSASGDIQNLYFGFQPLADERGFLYVHPDGTLNIRNERFWNATDGCCGFGFSDVDDSAYLTQLVQKVQQDYNVDPKRIYFVGHSNGGFMSYRMACDHADFVAAIASLAGATYMDDSQCAPSEPVSVLQIHGTVDRTIPYDGGSNLGNTFPGAEQTVATWAAHNSCDTTAVPMTTARDLDFGLDGDETSGIEYQGCADGTSVQLWTIEGGSHIPARTPDMATGIIDFLFAHPKP